MKRRIVQYAPTTEIDQRKREVQILLNVVEPDPEYQAFFVSDEASLLDVTGAPIARIRKRLDSYFQETFPFELNMRIPELVDALKSRFPDWPDEWPPGEA